MPRVVLVSDSPWFWLSWTWYFVNNRQPWVAAARGLQAMLAALAVLSPWFLIVSSVGMVLSFAGIKASQLLRVTSFFVGVQGLAQQNVLALEQCHECTLHQL